MKRFAVILGLLVGCYPVRLDKAATAAGVDIKLPCNRRLVSAHWVHNQGLDFTTRPLRDLEMPESYEYRLIGSTYPDDRLVRLWECRDR